MKPLWRDIRIWLLLVALFIGFPILFLTLLMLALIDWRILPTAVIGIVACGLIGEHVFNRRICWRERGLCVACGYNLTGNVSGICPECGIGIGRQA